MSPDAANKNPGKGFRDYLDCHLDENNNLHILQREEDKIGLEK